jgi:hypothetical protein
MGHRVVWLVGTILTLEMEVTVSFEALVPTHEATQ